MGSKPEVNEPIPASHSDPDYQLTNLPDMLSNPQNSRPVTVVSPQNQNQTTSDNQTPQAEEDVSANTSAVRRQKCYQNYSDHSERRRVRQRERYRNDPDLAKSRRERYKNDPDYAERIRERQRQLRKNPAYVEREKQRKKEFRKDPAYVERQNRLLRERRKERRKDPAYVERQREYQREYRRKRLREFRKDPACAAVAYTNSTF
ncbi:hypothetical protein [Endozoicomonas sp. YOMI1]|uniref:hypothetical protein n=1 Tax=Endozoicomonas sp. YOMI1 TaxID=2828739 RepID=UPI002149600E|nr:hypothetical protein [Endozoicomonas sp. YOMI1]